MTMTDTTDSPLLGEILVRKGYISAQQLNVALDKIKSGDHRQLGHILAQEGYLPYTQILTTIMEEQHIAKAQKLLNNRNAHSEKSQQDEPPSPLSLPLPPLRLAKYPAKSQDELQVVAMAQDLIHQTYLDDAVHYLSNLLKKEPHALQAAYCLAWIYLKQKKCAQAMVLLRQQRPNIEDKALLFELLAYASQQTNKHKEAARMYQMLIKSPHNNPVWLLHLAYSLELSQHKQPAIGLYRYFLRIYTHDDQLHHTAQQRLDKLLTRYMC